MVLGNVAFAVELRAEHESNTYKHEKIDPASMSVFDLESDNNAKPDPNAIYKVHLTSRLALVQYVPTSMKVLC